MSIKLSVDRFIKTRPTLTWSFETEFKLNTASHLSVSDVNRLKYAVQSVELPTQKISADKKSYGSFDYILPIYEPGDRYLSITFEETDDCLIQGKLLPYLLGYRPMWYNARNAIDINVMTFDTYSHEIVNDMGLEVPQDREYGYTFKSTILDYDEGIGVEAYHETYTCKLLSYTEPAYSHAGNITGVTCTLKFLVMRHFRVNDNSGIILGKNEAADAASTKPPIFKEYAWPEVKGGNAIRMYRGDAKKYKALLDQMHKDLGKDNPTLAEVQQYLIKNGIYQKDGVCASGVSLTLSLYENKQQYVSHGNGNNYQVRQNDNGQSMSEAEIEKYLKATLKKGESVVISFDMANTNASANSKQYGHAIIVTKQDNDELLITSDFKQQSWKTYSNLNGAKFRLMKV